MAALVQARRTHVRMIQHRPAVRERIYVVGYTENLLGWLYVSIREAAECLGISEKRVYRLVQDGTLGGKKIGKAWFIRYADVACYEKED